MKTKIIIEGMSCGHCVKHVNEALSELERVENVIVSLEDKSAIFDSSDKINEDKIKSAIDEAGYDVIKIEQI